MFSKEQLQRFSIRKLTVGAASVLIGVSFMTEMSNNKVYADVRTTNENSNSQVHDNSDGNTLNLSTDLKSKADESGTADSEVTNNSNAKVGGDSVTDNSNARNVEIKNIDDSKKDQQSGDAVAPKEKTANTIQKHEENVAKGTTVDSNDLQVAKTQADLAATKINGKASSVVSPQIKQIQAKYQTSKNPPLEKQINPTDKNSDGKVVVKAEDPSNYPSELNNLIGKDKYIYQVLSLNNYGSWYPDSELILSVNRNDSNDKNIYAYVIDNNGEIKTATVGVDQNKIIVINKRGYQINNDGSSNIIINGNKESTQNSSTVTSAPGYYTSDGGYYDWWDVYHPNNIYHPYSNVNPIEQGYGLGSTTSNDYSAIGEIIPIYTESSVIKYYYCDDNGDLQEFKDSDLSLHPNVVVTGLTGQEFKIPNVDQYKQVIPGFYLTSKDIPTNFTGTLSQFEEGKYYKKAYYNYDTDNVKYYSVYHQVSPDGKMAVGVFDKNGKQIIVSDENGHKRPKLIEIGAGHYTTFEFQIQTQTQTQFLTVRNPYVTAAPHEVQFIYKKLGSIIPVDESGNQIGDAVQFNNDNDPTKAGITDSPEIKNYKIKDPNQKEIIPLDPGKDIRVIYVHDTKQINPDHPTDKYTKNDLQKKITRTINYVDDKGNKIADSVKSTVTFTGSGVVDVVTGNLVNLNPDGSIKNQNGHLIWTYSVDGGASQNGDSYTFASTAKRLTIEYNGSTYSFSSVDKTQYGTGNGAVSSYFVGINNHDDLTVNVIYNKQPTYRAGKTETKEITRTINYLDGEDKTTVVAPQVKQTSTLSRTEVLNNDGAFIGYGDISLDGKTYTLNSNWKVDRNWAGVTSPNLSSKGYKAPSITVVDGIKVDGNTEDTIVNVYYDHDTKQINSNNPTDKYTKGNLQKKVTRTIKYLDGKRNEIADSVSSTVTFNGSGVVDAVTGNLVNLNSDGSIKDQNGHLTWTYSVDDGASENGSSYTFASTASKPIILYDGSTYDDPSVDQYLYDGGNGAVKAYDVDVNNNPTDLTVNVIYTQVTYHVNAKPKTRQVTRIINYLDDEDHSKIVAPQVTQTAILKRTEILDNKDNVIGYGTVSADGKNYSIDNNWKVDKTWTSVASPKLSSKGYKAPSIVIVDEQYVNENTKNTIVNVYYGHDIKSVNPNNPDDRVNLDQYIQDVRQTITYVDSNGNSVHENNAQNAQWTRTITIDAVTGEVIAHGKYDKDWAPSKTNYDEVKNPVIDGYYTKNQSVLANQVEQQNTTVKVVYNPLGHIIPVDKDGNPILGQDHPQFKSDPNDPTKAVPGEVPNVPGYHPEDKNVKPGNSVPVPSNPGEDVKIPYTKDQGIVQVIFNDDTTNTLIPNIGYNLDEKSQDSNTPVNYDPTQSINDLEKQGYVYVRTEGTIPAVVPTETNVQVIVHMKHGVQEITPTSEVPKNSEVQPSDLTKKVTLDVEYQNADGSQFTGTLPPEAQRHQTATFTGTAYVDKITGKQVNAKQENGQWVIDDNNTTQPSIAWTGDKTSFDAVVSPSENGYHVDHIKSDPSMTESIYKDGDNVKAIDGLTKESQNIRITVVYVQNDVTATVKYYDDTDSSNDLSKYNKTITGKAGSDLNYTTQGTIDQLKGDGYVLVSDSFSDAQLNGKMPAEDGNYEVHLKHGVDHVTPETPVDGYKKEDLQKTVETTVTYKDDKGHVLNQVINTNTFTAEGYYDKVTRKLVNLNEDGTIKDQNGQLTWSADKTFDAIPARTFDGYTFDNVDIKSADSKLYVNKDTGAIGAQTMTPTTANSAIEVIYSKDINAVIKYYDDTDSSNDLSKYNKTITGKAGSDLNYTTQGTIDQLKGDGYVLVSDSFSDAQLNGKMPAEDGNYEVHLKHGVDHVTPETPVDGYKKEDLQKTVETTVTYKDDKGHVLNQVINTNTFTAEGYYDKVTRKLVNLNEDGTIKDQNGQLTWSADKTFDAIPARTFDGYTFDNVDIKSADSKLYVNKDTGAIGAQTMTPTTANSAIEVIYSKDINAVIKYYDDTDSSNDLSKYNKTITGKAGSDLNYTTQGTIDQLKGDGYVLVSDSFSDAQLNGKMPAEDGNYEVHLKHGVDHVTPETPVDGYKKEDLQKTVETTVTYKDDKGHVLNQVINTNTFTAEGYYDKVTRKLVNLNEDGTIKDQNGQLTWSADKTFDAIPARTFDGYTFDNVDIKSADSKLYVNKDTGAIGAQTMTPTTANSAIEVIYSKDINAVIKYYDDTDSSNDLSKYNKTITGKAGSDLNYTTQGTIDQLKGDGYVLVSDSFSDAQLNGKMPAEDGNYEVHLKHGVDHVTPETPVDGYKKEDLQKTVETTVTYKDDKGHVLNQVINTNTFTAEGYYDKVTRKLVNLNEDGTIKDQNGQLTWSADKTFDAIPARTFDGYTFDNVDIKSADSKLYVNKDTGAIGAQTMTPTTANSAIEVIYSKDINAVIKYYDDTDSSNDLSKYNKTITGKAGSDLNYTTQGTIDQLKGDGYVLVSDSFSDAQLNGKMPAEDGNYEVHLKHGVDHVTPETPVDGYKKEDLQKTVETTVTYKDDKGHVLNQVINTNTFTAEGYYDKVTRKLVNLNEDGTIKDQNGQLTWSADKTFDAIPARTFDGYTFDNVDIKSADSKLYVNKDTGAIGAQTMTPTTANSAIEVIYSKDINAAVHYIDEDQNNRVILSSVKLTGKEGKQIGYSSANDLKNLTDKGYVLDGNGYDPEGRSPKFDSAVSDYYIYLKHGKVTVTPENPGKPGEPINPNDSDPNGPKWPDDTDANSLTKTGTQTIHYVGAGDKTPADNTQTFTFIKSMVIDKVTGKVLDPGSWNIDSHTFGTVKTPVISGYHADKAVAGGTTVTPDDLNRVITVTYAPDGNPDNPGDQGDTPTPEPTPEPEPIPNPNPDDQPDSEISSDDNFEKVEAKDKLDKTNPKKVDAYKKERKIIKTKIAKQGHTEIAEPIEDKVTRENNVKVVSDPVENKAAEPKLPQTGEADNSIIGLLGMLLASFAAMFGFDSLHSHDKKHKN